MNKQDRGIIKWQPFESLTPTKQIIKSILLEKSKVTKPILSDEEIKCLEDKIIEAYYSSININIHYYTNGYIKVTKGKIKKIDQIYKMIYLDNNLKLLFNQILDIDTK